MSVARSASAEGSMFSDSSRSRMNRSTGLRTQSALLLRRAVTAIAAFGENRLHLAQIIHRPRERGLRQGDAGKQDQRGGSHGSAISPNFRQGAIEVFSARPSGVILDFSLVKTFILVTCALPASSTACS